MTQNNLAVLHCYAYESRPNQTFHSKINQFISGAVAFVYEVTRRKEINLIDLYFYLQLESVITERKIV